MSHGRAERLSVAGAGRQSSQPQQGRVDRVTRVTSACHLGGCERLKPYFNCSPTSIREDSISGVLYIQLNTIIAGIVEALAGLVYIKAGFKGETWKPLIARERRDVKVRSCERTQPVLALPLPCTASRAAHPRPLTTKWHTAPHRIENNVM